MRLRSTRLALGATCLLAASMIPGALAVVSDEDSLVFGISSDVHSLNVAETRIE